MPKKEEELDELQEFSPEEEEEEDVEEEEDGRVVPDAEPAPAAPPPRRKHRKTTGVGKPKAPTTNVWANVPPDADQRWAVLIERLARQGKTPYDVVIRVCRAGPPMQAMPGTLDGAAVAGSSTESPGDMLIEAVINYWHEQARGPMQYIVNFFDKPTGKFLAQGKLSLPAPEEVFAFRQRRAELERRGRTGAGAPPAAPVMAQQASPQAAPSAPAYYQPYPPPTQSGRGELDLIRAELAESRAFQARLLDELIKAQREGRPPNATGLGAPGIAVPAAAPPVPPQGMYSESEMERMFLRFASRLGLPTTPAVAAPAQKPATVAQQGAETLDAFKSIVTQMKQFKSLGRELSNAFGDDEPAAAAEPIVEPPPPEDKDILPFQLAPVPDATLFDKPIQYAVDRETGGISWPGLAFANPQVAEKLIDIGGRLVEGLGKIAKGFAEPPPGVGRPPRGGNGAAPAQMQPAPPPPGDEEGSGWPTQ